MPFYDLNEVKSQDMPGRTRKLVVGKNLMMVFVERHEERPHDHAHENEQMLYLLDGRAICRLGDEEREIGPSQVVHVPSGMNHHLELLTPTNRYIGIYSPPREAVIKAEA